MDKGENLDKQPTGLPIYSALGHRFVITHAIIRRSVSQPRFLVFVGLVVAILTLFDTHNYGQMLGPWRSALVWTVSVTLIVLLYSAITSLLISLKAKLEWLVVYMPVVGSVSMALSSVATIHFVYVLHHEPVPASAFWSHLPFNIAAMVIFETLFFVFVAPILMQNLAAKTTPTEKPKALLLVENTEIAIEEIVYLKAQDHYVSITLRDRAQLLLRARLRDMVRLLGDADGGMVHRSYWVAWHAVRAYEVSENSQHLILNNGTKLPVAKGRRKNVERGLSLYAKNTPSGECTLSNLP